MMLGFAETTGCRRRFLLGYFGESSDAPCGACDVCTSPSSGDTVVEGVGDAGDESVSRAAAVSYPAGGDRIIVLFESMGYRTLSLPAIAGKGLLTADSLSAAPPPATS